MTFREFRQSFLKYRRKLVRTKRLASSSLHSDRIRLRKLNKFFGRLDLSSITPEKVEQFLDRLIDSGRSLALANRYRSLLSVYFTRAMREGACSQNPVKLVSSYPERRTRPKTEIWDADERDKYLVAAERVNPEYGILAHILLLSGIRINECTPLRFIDVHFPLGYISISRIIERHSRKIEYRTKGQKANGSYMALLFPRLAKVLKGWKKKTGRLELDLIARRHNGSPLDYDRIHDYHYQSTSLAGVKPIKIHGMRATYASLLARDGYHLVEIAKALGHETLDCVGRYAVADMRHLLKRIRR